MLCVIIYKISDPFLGCFERERRKKRCVEPTQSFPNALTGVSNHKTKDKKKTSKFRVAILRFLDQRRS